MAKAANDATLNKCERDDRKRYGDDFNKSVTRVDVHKCFGMHVKLHNKLSEQLSDTIEKCEYEVIEEFSNAKSEARLLFQALTRSTKIVADIYSKLDAQDIEAKKLVNEEDQIDEAYQGFMKMLGDLGIDELDAIGFKDAILKKAAKNDQSSEEANDNSFQDDHGATSGVDSFGKDDASLSGFAEHTPGNLDSAEQYHGSSDRAEKYSDNLERDKISQSNRDEAVHFSRNSAKCLDKNYSSNSVYEVHNSHAGNTGDEAAENNSSLRDGVVADNVFRESHYQDEQENSDNQQVNNHKNLRQDNTQHHVSDSEVHPKNDAQQSSTHYNNADSKAHAQNGDYQNIIQQENIQRKQLQKADSVCSIEGVSKKLTKGRVSGAGDAHTKQRKISNSSFYAQQDYPKKSSNLGSVAQNFSHLPNAKSTREHCMRTSVRKIFVDKRANNFSNSAYNINAP